MLLARRRSADAVVHVPVDAFVLPGAVPVLIDIRADTLNMDDRLIEAAISERRRAIVPVHYAGVGVRDGAAGSRMPLKRLVRSGAGSFKLEAWH